jgi:catalase (peroxidase I)
MSTSTLSAPASQQKLGLLVGGALVGTGAYLLANNNGVEAQGATNWTAVKADIAGLLENENYDDGSYGPLFVRLAWHASGTYDAASKTGGSNGATMRYAPESSDGANAGLDIARNLLEPIKRKHPSASYADIWTLAGSVAIEELGGPSIDWRAGRTDYTNPKNVPPNGRLPDAAQGAAHLRDVFYRMGFNDREIVVLAGAHCLGRCHTDRSGFWGPWTRAPTSFTNEYFRELLENTWTVKKWNGPKQYEDPTGELMMLVADLALIQDPKMQKYVEIYKDDEELFFSDFASAWKKLIELGVPF